MYFTRNDNFLHSGYKICHFLRLNFPYNSCFFRGYSERDDGPEGFAFSHQFERVVNLFQFEFVGDDRFQLDFSGPDHFYDLGIVHRAAAQRSLDFSLPKHQSARVDRDIMVRVAHLAVAASGFHSVGSQHYCFGIAYSFYRNISASSCQDPYLFE